MPKLYYWMAVTPDKYELPLAVEESSDRLAKTLGIGGDTVRTSESRNKSGKICGYKIVKTERT